MMMLQPAVRTLPFASFVVRGPYREHVLSYVPLPSHSIVVLRVLRALRGGRFFVGIHYLAHYLRITWTLLDGRK